MNLRPVFLAIASLVTTPLTAQEPKTPPGAEPIPMPATALLEKDYAAQERQWAERCLLETAKKKWQGQAWADEAAKLVAETLQLEEVENAPLADLGSLAPRYKALLAVVAFLLVIALLVQRFVKPRENQ